MRKYLARLKNKGTVLSLVGFVIVILVNCGFEIDSNVVYNLVNAICGILILLGVMNNPDTGGVDLPAANKNESEDK